MFNMNLWRGFKLATTFNGNSAPPYNITTGHDDNNDTVSNDRPAGVGRNAARASTIAGTLAPVSATPLALDSGLAPTVPAAHRSWSFAPAAAVTRRWAASVAAPRTSAGASSSSLAATNVLNHTNFMGYSGVMTSPFFGEPTSAGAARKMEVGARFGF